MCDLQFQGDLDGLCGMYSVYNAVRKLFGNHMHKDELVGVIKEAMDQFEPITFKNMFYDGMSVAQLDRLINGVKKLLKKCGFTMVIGKEQSMRCDAMLRKMKACQEREDCVFIIGISGRCEHWTCVETASTECMMLIDSGVMQQLRQSSFRVSDDESPDSVHKVSSEFWVLKRV